MARFFHFFGFVLKKLVFLRVPFPRLTFGRVMASLSLLGLVGLAYLYGAAVMFFQLPSYNYLDQAFAGAKAWRQHGVSTIPFLTPEEAEVAHKEGILVDKAEKTADGFTLFVTTAGAQATLLDMRGNVIHRWQLPFSEVWPREAHHVADPLPDDQIHWFHCYLYPNGDLLAIYHGDGDTPYGYGLIKINKDSKLLWSYANNVHHDVDVGEDGTIYTLIQKIETKPPAGLDSLATSYLADSLVVLSSEGQELQSIPIAEAFARSPYGLALSSDRKLSALSSPFALNVPTSDAKLPPKRGRAQSDDENDLLHTNCVKVISRAFAAKFPQVQEGQLLVSLRSLDTLAALDRHTRSVVWATQGLWRAQHDAELLENGNLLVYDNLGSLKQTRILEYDPRTQAIPWSYSNEDSKPFKAIFRGMKQRLSNGNTFIVDPDNRRLFEVTRDKELVWENICPFPSVPKGMRPRKHPVNFARRYRPDKLSFLKGTPARP